MDKLVWKHLPLEDLEAFRAYLEALPPGGRPRYGLLGIKASWWSRLGGGARPFVVLVAGGRVALSKRSFRRHEELSREERSLSDLEKVAVRRGPLLESVRLTFTDGYAVRLGGLPRRHSLPLEQYLSGDAEALDPARLSAEQLTNFHQALSAVGVQPPRDESAPE